MLYYESTHLNEGNDVTRSNSKKEYVVFPLLAFQSLVWVSKFRSHDLMMLCLNLSDIAIITVEGADYRCIIHGISRFDSIHVLEKHLLDYKGIYKMYLKEVNIKNRVCN